MPQMQPAQSGVLFSPPDADRRYVEAWQHVLYLGAGLDDSRLLAEYGRLSGMTVDHIPPATTTSIEAYADVRSVGQGETVQVCVTEPTLQHIGQLFLKASNSAPGESIEIVTIRLRRYG